jgi:Tol biopolymer transport system component/predicted Ser/Thr protein kinase
MSPQQTIAHYRITSKLGEGGMGEVWRATDTKLGREVAIKILPDSFAQDQDRLARFTREAQVLASLNHPNIAAIYGVEENAIVMELVEGEMLRGPIPLSEALPLIQQLIDALEYAHEKGVVHRDLKPANIKITPEGRVKVLDFGLAKALAAGDSDSSPTITMRGTAAGAILGTAAYMSPEQARGQNVDRRADIWAFGVVVYEMLTGRRLFEGATMSETLAAVLTKEPELDAVPARMRRLLRLCLVKDPRQRLSHISGARLLLDESQVGDLRHSGSALPWLIAAGLMTLVAVIALWVAWRAMRPVERPLIRLNVDLGPDALARANTTVAISPDGTRLIFPARGADGKQQLATRLLDQAHATLLPGTQNASDPFFSPDGQWVGFFADGKLKKISVQGGAPVTLCDAPSSLGATWGEDGNIIAALSQIAGLSRLSAAGGEPQPLTKLGTGEVTHRWPQILPGGDRVLFTSSPSLFTLDSARIEAVSLKTGERDILQRDAYFGRYLPSGHLVYVHQGVLFGVAFDPGRLELRGTPAPLLEDVASNASTGGKFDFSRTGTLIYLPGKAAVQAWPVVWLDRSGKTQPLIATPGIYYHPRFSPDGKRLALAVRSDKGTDLFVYDWQRDTMMRLTFGAQGRGPVWTPDGKHIAFWSVFANGHALSWIRSDGAGKAEPLLESHNIVTPYSFSPDGQRLAYFVINAETGHDIWTLPLDLTDPDHPKPGKPEPFLRTPADEFVPAFSPNGRWIAYLSNESGRFEIYVRPFPGGGRGKWQISTGGGLYAIWSNNGRELFYESLDNRIMVLDYTVNGDSFVPGKPRLWSDKQIYYAGVTNLALAPDGKRFAVFPMPEAAPGEKGSVHVTFLLNFFDELKRRLPPGGR